MDAKVISPPNLNSAQTNVSTTSGSSSPPLSGGGGGDVVVPVKAAKVTWSEVSRKNCPVRLQQQQSTFSSSLPRPEKTVAETNRPHCYLDVRLKGTKRFRVVIRVRPDKAPFMSENFIQLCLGNKGKSYKGCKFFRCKADDHVVSGDFEFNNGSGGYSVLVSNTFSWYSTYNQMTSSLSFV